MPERASTSRRVTVCASTEHATSATIAAPTRRPLMRIRIPNPASRVPTRLVFVFDWRDLLVDLHLKLPELAVGRGAVDARRIPPLEVPFAHEHRHEQIGHHVL